MMDHSVSDSHSSASPPDRLSTAHAPSLHGLPELVKLFACGDVGTVDAAFLYARANMAVFPVHGVGHEGQCTCGEPSCTSAGKHPAVRNGFKGATRDIEVLRRWHGSGMLTDQHNLGLPTGVGNGIWVLDIDGPEGAAAVAELERENGVLPDTSISSTGRGQHFIFRYPEGSRQIRSRSAVLAKGVDVRGEGGYIVAPPSLHRSGVNYRFLEGLSPIADAPDWLMELVCDGVLAPSAGPGKRPAAVPLEHQVASTATQRPALGVDEVRDALNHIDPDCGYDDWLKIGMALHSGGHDVDAWEAWSSRGDKYEPGICEKKWASFSSGNGISMGSLIWMARQGGWGRQQEASSDHAVAVSPTFPRVTGTVEEAHVSIRQSLKHFWNVVNDYADQELLRSIGRTLVVGGKPTSILLPNYESYHVVQGALGAGKSHAIREEALAYLSTSPGSVGVIAVSSHKLLEEYEAYFAAHQHAEVRVAAYRGVDQPDPDQGGRTMCWRPAAARAWSRSGGKLIRLCAGCPHNGLCGTSKQRGREADLWIVPSNMIFAQTPVMIPKDRLSWLVIDEDPLPFAFVGKTKTEVESGDADDQQLLAVAEATALRDTTVSGGDGADEATSEDYATAVTALEKAIDGERLSVSQLEDAGLNVKLAFKAEAFAYRLHVSPDGDGSLTDEAVLTAARAVEGSNATVRKIVALWQSIRSALAEELVHVPGVRVVKIATPGGRVPMLDILYRKEIKKGWRVPTLLLDATASRDIVGATVQLPVSSWMVAEATYPPAVSARQVIGASFARSMLFPAASKGETALHAGQANVRKLLWYIEMRAGEFSGQGAEIEAGGRPDVLVVGQKELVACLRRLTLPENVEAAHYGNLAGLDRWKGVRCIIVVGRRMIPPRDAELLAEVLGTCDVEEVGGWYPRERLGLRICGSEVGVAVEVERHPDPLTEGLRFRAAEGEIIQAIGRARGLRRTDATPLQIDILGWSPLPGIEVDEIVDWKDAQPAIDEHLWARWRVRIDPSASHGKAELIASLLPDRFRNGQAVRDWTLKHKARSLSKSSIDILIEQSDSERRTRGKIKPAGGRYAVPMIQHEGGRQLPLHMLGPVKERRGWTLLTKGLWFIGDEASSSPRNRFDLTIGRLHGSVRTILGAS